MGLFDSWSEKPINKENKDSKWDIFTTKESKVEEEDDGDYTITFGLFFKPKE